MSATSRKLIGQILLKNGCLTPDQLDEGLAKQENSDKRLGDILIALSYIKEDDLLQALSEQFGLPFLKSLPPESADRELIGRVPRTFAQAHQIVPLRREGDAVVVATADPLNTPPLDDIGHPQAELHRSGRADDGFRSASEAHLFHRCLDIRTVSQERNPLPRSGRKE